MGKITYVSQPKSTDPIKQIKIENGKGYFDLVLNLNKNGKAIRISDKFGEQRINITLDKLEELVRDLRSLKSRGVKTSVNDVQYDAA